MPNNLGIYELCIRQRDNEGAIYIRKDEGSILTLTFALVLEKLGPIFSLFFDSQVNK